jgi:hypothetical protein
MQNVIDDCQIGFTRKARTSDHMFILKCIIDQYCKTKDRATQTPLKIGGEIELE